jgi:hypothetical protein
MERRNSTNEVKVFKFGARKGPLKNEELALSQIWLQNMYRNALVQIDREFRSRYNAIVSGNNSALKRIGEISERIKELRKTIKLQRTGVQRAGWRALSHAEKAEINTLNSERKQLKPEADRVKRINKTTYLAKIRALNQEFYAAIKAVKAKFADGTYSFVDRKGNCHGLGGAKLFWMNEEHVYNNFLKDRAAAMRGGTVLNFHSYQGEGVVTCRPRVQAVEEADRPMTVDLRVQGAKSRKISLHPSEVEGFLASNPGAKLARADVKRFEKWSVGKMGKKQKVQRNITAAQAFDANNGSAFYFTVQNTGEDNTSKRSKRLVKAFAHLQIGTNPKTFFSLPVILHRPFPEGTTFRSVAAKRERVGRNYRWSLLVTADFPAPPPAHGLGVVALDPGWAMGSLPEPDGRLRVGGLTDENGKFRELSLPPKFMSQVQQVNKLQSIIARETNALMPRVQDWVDKHREESDLRTLFQRALLAQSNAKRRQREAGGFRHLIKAAGVIWPEILPPERRRPAQKLDDAGLERELKGWYKRFRHLDEWMRNLSDQNNASKLNLYRNWASQAAKRYHTVVIDDSDFHRAAEAPSAEKDQAQPAGGQRQVAAPGLLVAAFQNAFHSAGGEVRWVLGMTSRTCSKCGNVNPPLGPTREFHCQACGYTADRELNAGQNLIDEYRAGRSTSERRSTELRKPPTVSSNLEVCEKNPSSEGETPLESVT